MKKITVFAFRKHTSFRDLVRYAIDNSLATTLFIINFCLIATIYKSDIMFHQQFFLFNLFAYLSFKGYERYNRYLGIKDYKYLKRRNLEKFFLVTTIVSCAVGMYVDVMHLMEF